MESKSAFMQRMFPEGKRKGNIYAEITCPECGNKALAYYTTNENFPFGCKACDHSGNVYTLGYEKDPYQINEDNFDKELSRFRTHGSGGNSHRLPSRVLDVFNIQYREIRSARGKQWPAITLWKGNDLECWLGLNKESQKWQWFAPTQSVYGKRENPFLFTDLIDNSIDETTKKKKPVYIVAGQWDAFALFTHTGIIPFSTRNGESTRIHKPEHADVFSNRDVYILFDNDPAGRNGPQNLACDILRFVKAKIKIIPMVELVQRGGEDLDDFFNIYHGKKEELFKLIEATPYFKPPELVERIKVLNHPDPNANLDHMVQYAIKKDFEVRYNVIKNCPEYKTKDMPQFNRVDDRAINGMILHLREYEELEKLTKNRFDQNFYSPYTADYNPFKNFFDNLPEWDGVDHIQALSDLIKTDATCSPYKYEYLKFWLVGCVAQMFPDDEYNLRKKFGQRGKNQYCLIFAGGQQKRKTDFFEHLASFIGYEYFYSGDINPSAKDHQILVAENAIIHLDELSDKVRYHKTLEQYKSLIAGAQTINVRKPYDREHMQTKRHASFGASINDAQGLLDDLTGARRWMILTGVDVDISIFQMDLSSLWAQCFYLYKTGFKHWYDDPDILNSRNEAYRRQRIEEELIVKAICETRLLSGKYSASEILIDISKEYPEAKHLNAVNIGKICQKLFKSTRVRGVNKYIVSDDDIRRIKDEPVQEKIFNEDEFNEDAMF